LGGKQFDGNSQPSTLLPFLIPKIWTFHLAFLKKWTHFSQKKCESSFLVARLAKAIVFSWWMPLQPFFVAWDSKYLSTQRPVAQYQSLRCAGWAPKTNRLEGPGPSTYRGEKKPGTTIVRPFVGIRTPSMTILWDHLAGKVDIFIPLFWSGFTHLFDD